MDNTKNICQTQKRIDRHGANNPMFGRHHSIITRQKQSDAAKKRYQQYKQWKDYQAHITMDELLGSQPIHEYISSLIKEEIKKLL